MSLIPKDLLHRVSKFSELMGPSVILELDLCEEVLETPPPDPISRIRSRHKVVLQDIVTALDDAASDPHVHGLIARVGRARMGIARVQELRDAVSRFRESGKDTVAWAETLGELAPGTLAYYLATAFETLWLQPSGDLFLPGAASQTPFLADALDRVGITPQFGKRYEYKNAVNIFTEREFTPAHRESTTYLVNSILDQIVAGIAERRGKEPAEVRAVMEQGSLTAEQALAAGLVDHLGYRDEVYDAVRNQAGDKSVLRFLTRYRKTSPAAMVTRLSCGRENRAIGLIYATGLIRSGRSVRGVGAGESVGSDTLTAALRAARRDSQLGAVVLRVNSRGGSYVASDTIRREVALTCEAGLPVVVSMGDVAASGGYFISMAADAIVVQPGTLTGSIGVFGGKQVIDRLFDKLSIRHETISSGKFASIFSPLQKYSDEEWDLVNRWLDHVYNDFAHKVAQHRHLTESDVDTVARGRVWTGAEARERGLADELGGLERAFQIAAEKAHLDRAKTQIRVIPKMSLVDRLRPPQSSEDPAAAGMSAPAEFPGELWESFVTVVNHFGWASAGPLIMPSHIDLQ